MRLSVTPEFYTAIKQRRMRVALFAELQFGLGTFYYWTRRGTISWQGVTWYGFNGNQGTSTALLGVTKTTETNEIKSTNVSFQLSGVPIYTTDGNNLMLMCSRYAQNGLSAKLWLGLFNLNTDALIADPSQFFFGQLDVPIVEPGVDKFTITINAVSRVDILQNRCGLRYNLESHQKRFPGDMGFEFPTRSMDEADNFGP